MYAYKKVLGWSQLIKLYILLTIEFFFKLDESAILLCSFFLCCNCV